MSPTARALKELRDNGWTAQVVEKWNFFAKIRQDLFRCIDLVAIKDNSNGVFGVQATSRTNINARIKKSMNVPELRTWLQAGNRFAVVGWGKRKNRWEPAWREITLACLDKAQKEVEGGVKSEEAGSSNETA